MLPATVRGHDLLSPVARLVVSFVLRCFVSPDTVHSDDIASSIFAVWPYFYRRGDTSSVVQAVANRTDGFSVLGELGLCFEDTVSVIGILLL